MSEWQPVDTAPRDEEAIFWICPLTKDDCYALDAIAGCAPLWEFAMLEQMVGLKKLTIHQCQELAKDFGYDGATFDLCGPKGKKPARWLDAYMGLFQIDGMEGFMHIKSVEFAPDIWCENLLPKGKVTS